MFSPLVLAEAPPGPPKVRELIAADRVDSALELARSLAAEADDADTITALGEALYRAGSIDEAGASLAPLAAKDDAPARALAELGLVRAAQGKDDEARALMERAVAAAPADPWVAFRAAGTAASRAKAIERLEAYLSGSPDDDRDRIEGAKGTIRLYRALGERKVWVPVRRPDRLDLPLKPLPGTGGGYVVEASIANGKKLRLLLDTGSSGLFVVLRAVKKGGLSPLSEETVFAGGDAGRTVSSRGLLSRFALGDLEFSDALATTTKDEFDPQGRIHGVLGLSVFSGYRVTIDLAHGRLSLSRGGGELDGAPYWSVEGQMLVRASVAPGRDGLFLFDTGAVRSMLSRSIVATLPGAKTDRPASVRTYGGNVADASSVRGVKLRYQQAESGGDPVHASDLTQRSRLSGVEVAGFLGMDVLDRTTIVVDTDAQRVSVTAAKK